MVQLGQNLIKLDEIGLHWLKLVLVGSSSRSWTKSFLVLFFLFVVFLDTINLPCKVIDGEFWFWSSDWETFLSVMSLPAKDEKCSVSNALWQIWCRKQKNELCTAWTYDKVIDEKRSNSTHSKPFTMARTRLLKCFVLQHSEVKTMHLRSLARGVVLSGAN